MAANQRMMFGWLYCRRSRSALSSLIALILFAGIVHAEKPLNVFDDDVFDDDVFAESFADAKFGDSEATDPDAAAFDKWESVVEEEDLGKVYWNDPALTPFDYVRHFGFRHSSTHGRHVGRGLPMEGTSWKNRPYHVDWFAGPLLGGDLVKRRVAQDNDLFGGFRIGHDFDYYWGLEARFGWAKPNVQFVEPQMVASNGSYFVSDVDVVYYPWGDSKIRPYVLLGAGMARINFVDDASTNFNATLFTTPFGGGIQFRQWSWMLWRLEILNNYSFGADGVEAMSNYSFTAGMELRLGSRPASYWPWRSSRKIW